MKWVKASERLPEPGEKLYLKVAGNGFNGMCVGRMTDDHFFRGGWDDDADDFLTFKKKDIEWLDETPSPALAELQEENEKLIEERNKYSAALRQISRGCINPQFVAQRILNQQT